MGWGLWRRGGLCTVHDQALRFDKERKERLCHGYVRPYVELKELYRARQIDIGNGDIVYGAGIIYQDV